MNATQKQLDTLFPTPTPSPSGIAPTRLPGYDCQTTETLLELLKDNHKRYHIFFNDMGFHNHVTHHLLSIYAMGANSTTLRAAYETHVAYLKPAFQSPSPIDKTNWKDHLGDEKYYQSYLEFFASLILSGSPETALEEYVMSKEANVVPGGDGKPPLMLSRFHAGFLHPLIHAGYGFEFGLPGLVAEGLAQTAIHPVEAEALFSAEMFDAISDTPNGIVSRLTSLSFSSEASPDKSIGPHALTILEKIIHDNTLSYTALGLQSLGGGPGKLLDRTVQLAGARIAEYAGQWIIGNTKEDLESKFTEITWLNTVIYTIGGWAGKEHGGANKAEFDADFFLMHLVTSTAMVSSLLGAMKPSSASLFLRTYFIFSLLVYVARGRPPLPIADFYENTTANPSPPGPVTQFEKGLSPSAPNSWLEIVQSTLVHPNEHLCKLQRALAHSAVLYGGTSAGSFVNIAEGGLKGAELLDGTLFVRSAGLTADRLGWMRAGGEQRDWGRQGYFF